MIWDSRQTVALLCRIQVAGKQTWHRLGPERGIRVRSSDFIGRRDECCPKLSPMVAGVGYRHVTVPGSPVPAVVAPEHLTSSRMMPTTRPARIKGSSAFTKVYAGNQVFMWQTRVKVDAKVLAAPLTNNVSVRVSINRYIVDISPLLAAWLILVSGAESPLE